MSAAPETTEYPTLSREGQCAQLRNCRPSTVILFNMCIANVLIPPDCDTGRDFGIRTRNHFNAFVWCFEQGLLGPEDIDRGWRRGVILTELTQQFFDQPHRVTFKTEYDTQGEMPALSGEVDIEWTSPDLVDEERNP
jgi:hypothetical protein